jgi:hypothetical protein
MYIMHHIRPRLTLIGKPTNLPFHRPSSPYLTSRPSHSRPAHTTTSNPRRHLADPPARIFSHVYGTCTPPERGQGTKAAHLVMGLDIYLIRGTSIRKSSRIGTECASLSELVVSSVLQGIAYI